MSSTAPSSTSPIAFGNVDDIITSYVLRLGDTVFALSLFCCKIFFAILFKMCIFVISISV